MDYDPSPDLEKIKARLLAINFADDEVNPPELGVVAVVQLRPVHNLEMGPVGHREAHVRHADLQEAAASLPGPAQRFGQV